jgi:esterase/lipase superfamily enzyme
MDTAMSAESTNPRHVWRWHSDTFGQTMGVARWGHYGRPVVLFPTGGGDFLDVERFLLVRALEPLVTAGRIKVYAVDSADRWCWTARDVPPQKKAAVQARYDRWLVDELVPRIRQDCGGTEQRFACAGASLGAYNAFNAAAKHPEVFDLCVGMSGTYVLDRRMEGHWDEDYYFNSPTRFLPSLGPCAQLDALRTTRFIFAVGAGPHENMDYSRAAAAACTMKDIPHRLDVWQDGDHDWPTWRRMLPAYLGWLG